MKALTFGIALTMACTLSIPGEVIAKGSSGHSGGGHAGGQTHGGTTSHGGAVAREASAPPARTASQPPARPPRSGQPVGTAVQRPVAPAALIPPAALVVTPSRIWPYYGTAFGLGGLGLYGLYDDPFWGGYSYGSQNAYGYQSAYAYGPTAAYPGSLIYGDAPYLPADGPTGGLRMKIEPKDAQVYVDGLYAGIVYDFNGHFQHLNLSVGSHHIEVRAPGHQPLAFDVIIQAHHTTVYTGTVMPLTP